MRKNRSGRIIIWLLIITLVMNVVRAGLQLSGGAKKSLNHSKVEHRVTKER